MLTLALCAALAAEAPKPDAPKWEVDAPHGPSHAVRLDLREATWSNVTVGGDRIVFDVLGDLWSIPFAGGEATRLTSGAAWDTQPRFSPDGKTIAFTTDRGGNENVWLMDADGKNPRALTTEVDARVTEPVWHPSGQWLYVRKRTVDTRSIGVTELWQVHLDGGRGVQLTQLDAHPHAAEVTTDGRYLWFSDRHGRFEYEGDPVGGLWDVQRLDLRDGSVHLAIGGAGSAARPMLSPDGTRLAFISRDRDQTVLEVVDLASGRRSRVLDGLSRDELEGFALHGTYPAMAWTPQGLVFWANGKLWRIAVPAVGAPALTWKDAVEIPFHVVGDWTLHDVQRWKTPIPDQVTAKVIRWPTKNAAGDLAFSAMGALWVKRGDAAPERWSPGTGYAPAWSPDGRRLAWTSWDDATGGALHVTDASNPKKRVDVVVPGLQGQLENPAWSPDGRSLAVLRGVGGVTSPDTGSAPWFELVIATPAPKGWTTKVVTALDGHGPHAPRPQWIGDRLWFTRSAPQEGRVPEDTALVSVALDGTDERTHVVFDGADEVVISPDGARIAYTSKHQAWVTAMPPRGAGAVKIADGGLPTTRLTQIVGDWIGWSPDGRAVTWVEGPTLKSKVVDHLGQRGVDPPKRLDDTGVDSAPIGLTVPRARPTGVKAYVGARVITMKGDEVLDGATVVVDGDRIVSVGTGPAPSGAEVIDVKGKTIVPGFIDIHAHLHYTATDVLPAQEWRYATSLDFGVTTVHDPSAATDTVFTQAERVEAGFMKGPRVYSTGYVLYGALGNDAADTPDAETARDHVRRMAAAGAISVKVYQQAQRERRQWYVAACEAEKILCVPEGGGDLYQNLGMIVDGYHAIEHALPEAPIYADVVGLFAGSRTAAGPGTAYTPTMLVAYGGLGSENFWWQTTDPLDHPLMRKHFPRRELDAAGWRRGVLAKDRAWNFVQVAKDAARLARAGVIVDTGAHGQLQGLGFHWEMWSLGVAGAMTPHEVLRAATLSGATYLGMQDQIGSIEPGKFADFVVLDADPLQDLSHTDDIAFTVKNGEIWK